MNAKWRIFTDLQPRRTGKVMVLRLRKDMDLEPFLVGNACGPRQLYWSKMDPVK